LAAGLFADRTDAGNRLGEEVARLDLPHPAVVALPRGGVPVGAEVARRLGAPLVALPVAKVGAPGREELAIGAVAPHGVKVLNHDVIAALRLSDNQVETMVSKAAAKIARQLELYSSGAKTPSLSARSVVVVDDGLATGASMWAALIAVREQHPHGLVLAVPVAPPEALALLAPLVDDEVCVFRPVHMQAVGAWYEDFSQTTDLEVAHLLAELGSEPADRADVTDPSEDDPSEESRQGESSEHAGRPEPRRQRGSPDQVTASPPGKEKALTRPKKAAGLVGGN
jgi:putative phosphoribosyl transferase